MIYTYITLPKSKFQEKSSFTATATFRLLNASTTPTTARYRIDDDYSGDEVRGWTDLTPASSIEIAITPDDNKSVNGSRREERRTLTVEANTDLDTQTRERVAWTVETIFQF